MSSEKVKEIKELLLIELTSDDIDELLKEYENDTL